MRFALLMLLGVVCLAWLGIHLRARHARRRERSADLVELRKLCDEDIGLLGEELRRLDTETTAHALDSAARGDYEVAQSAHKTAQRMVGEVTDGNEIGKVTESLASGHYALACVRARIEGHPIPELRVPCFFNPQHGPSVGDVAFTPRGHGTRKVPACASDVARHRANEEPQTREVEVGGRRVPYYEAGNSFAPYGEGYFAGDAAIKRLFVTSTSWSGEPRSRASSDPMGLRTDGTGT